MFYEAALLKESAKIDTDVCDEHNNKLLKVKLSDDKDSENAAYDDGERAKIEAKNVKTSDLQQVNLQNYQLAKNRIIRQTKRPVRYC